MAPDHGPRVIDLLHTTNQQVGNPRRAHRSTSALAAAGCKDSTHRLFVRCSSQVAKGSPPSEVPSLSPVRSFVLLADELDRTSPCTGVLDP